MNESRVKQAEAAGSFLRGTMGAVGRQRKVALATFVVLTLLGGLLIALMPRRYNAEMKILVSNGRPAEVVTPGASAPQLQSDVDETQVNSEIALLTNAGLLRSLAEQLLPAGGPQGADEARAVEREMKKIAAHLHVEAVRKSNIIEVAYADRNPERAQRVLQLLLAGYMDAHTRAHAAPGTYSFFKEQADSFAGQLAEVDAEMERLEASGGAVDVPQQEELLVKGREEVRSAMLASAATIEGQRKSITEGQATFQDVPSSLETESRSVPNQYAIERMRTLLVELRNKRTDLLTNFPTTDRQVQDLDRQIAITDESLRGATRDENVERVHGINPVRQTLETELNRVGMSLAAEQGRKEALGRQVKSYDQRLAALARLKLAHVELERRHTQTEASYLLYAHKEEEARAAEALDAQRFSNISVIEAPLAFHTASQPKVTLDLVLVFALAFCLAIVTALVIDRRNGGVEDAETIEEITGLPVLGMLTVVQG